MTLPINFPPCGTVPRCGRYGWPPRVAGGQGDCAGLPGGQVPCSCREKRHPDGLRSRGGRSPGRVWLTDHLSDTRLPVSPAEPSGTPAPTRLRFSPGSGVTGRLG